MSVVLAETAVVPAQRPRGSLRFPVEALEVSRNPYWVYLYERPEGESRRTIKGSLDLIAEILSPTHDPSPGERTAVKDSGENVAWWLLRWDDTALLKARLTERGYTGRSIARHLSAYRQVLQCSRRLGHMTAEDCYATIEIEAPSVDRLPAGRNIGDDEIADMLKCCLTEPGPIAVRDAAVIAVLASTGARREEAAGMLIEKFDTPERIISIIGKGNKEREVYLYADALVYTGRWLSVLGARNGPIFRSITKTGIIKDQALQGQDVGRIVARRCKQAGVRPTTTHDFRRTLAGKLLDAGVDIVVVKEILGHSQVTTTAAYDRRPSRGRRAAIDLLHLPLPEELLGRKLADSDDGLTVDEQRAITSLKELGGDWPQSLRLACRDGSLVVVRNDPSALVLADVPGIPNGA